MRQRSGGSRPPAAGGPSPEAGPGRSAGCGCGAARRREPPRRGVDPAPRARGQRGGGRPEGGPARVPTSAVPLGDDATLVQARTGHLGTARHRKKTGEPGPRVPGDEGNLGGRGCRSAAGPRRRPRGAARSRTAAHTAPALTGPYLHGDPTSPARRPEAGEGEGAALLKRLGDFWRRREGTAGPRRRPLGAPTTPRPPPARTSTVIPQPARRPEAGEEKGAVLLRRLGDFRRRAGGGGGPRGPARSRTAPWPVSLQRCTSSFLTWLWGTPSPASSTALPGLAATRSVAPGGDAACVRHTVGQRTGSVAGGGPTRVVAAASPRTPRLPFQHNTGMALALRTAHAPRPAAPRFGPPARRGGDGGGLRCRSNTLRSLGRTAVTRTPGLVEKHACRSRPFTVRE